MRPGPGGAGNFGSLVVTTPVTCPGGVLSTLRSSGWTPGLDSKSCTVRRLTSTQTRGENVVNIWKVHLYLGGLLLLGLGLFFGLAAGITIGELS